MFARHFFVVLALSLAALASACQSPSSQYLMNGIGASLPAPDMDRALKLQNAYFNFLCRQAGLVENPFGSEPGNCSVQARDEGGWSLIVRQGMNDIDRRCDAYLEWLDNKQRSKGPLLAQVRDVQETVKGVMFAIDPGSTAALQIVSLAFGLVNRSIENYNSRLIMAVEPSTRNSVVLNALRRFREQVRDEKLSFSSRPDAEYALREYMRRCLPFAIEAQINDLSTLGSQGISPESARTIFEAPVGLGTDFSAKVSSPLTPTDLKPDRPPRKFGQGAVSDTEKRVSETELKSFQRILCVPDDGVYGKITRANILLFQLVAGNREQAKSSPGVLNKKDVNILRQQSPCRASFKNYYEDKRISDPATIMEIAKALKKDFPEIDENASISDLRPFIASKRKKLNLDNGPGGFFTDQITPELTNAILDKG